MDADVEDFARDGVEDDDVPAIDGEDEREPFDEGTDGVDCADEKRIGSPSVAASGKLFVGGIAWKTTKKTFTEYFEKYGEITDSVIMKDKQTKKPRGFGFVTFADPSVIEKVMKDDHVIDGRTVEVKQTVPREEMATEHQTRKIFVGGIPKSVTDDELKEYFSSYGKVVEHHIMTDQSGNSRGFGFIIFESGETVEEILSGSESHEIKGKQVEIKKAEPKRSTESQGSSRRKSHGGSGSSSAYGGSSNRSAGGYGGRMAVYGGAVEPGYGGYGYGFGFGGGGAGSTGGYGTGTFGTYGYGAYDGYGSRVGGYGGGVRGGYGSMGGYGGGGSNSGYGGSRGGYGGGIGGYAGGMGSYGGRAYGGAGGSAGYGSSTNSRYHPYGR